MKRVCFIVVGDRPQCIWQTDPVTKNIEFLKGVDWGYFGYVARAHGENLTGTDRLAAALSLRAAYLQGLETLFAFLWPLYSIPALCSWLVGGV